MVGYTTITSRNQTVQKVVKGKTYVYERVPYYNPRIRNTSYHYRYVGRKDNGGIRKIRSALPRRSLIHGTFIPIMKIVNDMGIEDMLEKHPLKRNRRRSLQSRCQRLSAHCPWHPLTHGSTAHRCPVQ